MAKLTMTGLPMAERGAVVQRAYCGHAYLLRAEGSRIQSQLGVGASEAVVTPRHARCMLWAYGGWRPLAWNRCQCMHALSAHRRSTVGIGQGGVLQVRLRVASGSVSSGWMGPRLPICTILTMAKKTVSGVWAIASRESLVA